jgi:hypothetical protein
VGLALRAFSPPEGDGIVTRPSAFAKSSLPFGPTSSGQSPSSIPKRDAIAQMALPLPFRTTFGAWFLMTVRRRFEAETG